MMIPHTLFSRRILLGGAAVVGGLSLGRKPARLFAQEQAPTPQCPDSTEPTPREGEGPFYKPDSPERTELIEPGSQGRPVALQGVVMTRSCRPVEGALLDLWHADENGHYDNSGFRYRGHTYTDGSGRFLFRTILPGLYPSRTRHYHLKVQAPGQPLLTTQLYFPNEPRNNRDSLYMPELEVRLSDAPQGLAAGFDFVLDMA